MNIKKYRVAAGVTQEQLAAVLEVDQSAVSQWESGKTSPCKKYLPKIANFLGCTVEELQSEEQSA